MSLSVIAVAPEKLNRLVGSNDEATLKQVISTFQDEISDFDEAYADLIEGGEARSASIAVKDLLGGGSLIDDEAHSLRFAAWLLSQHVGRTVDLESFAEMHSSFLREADRLFESIGISEILTFDRLTNRGLPKTIGFNDYPPFESGYLLPEECAEVDNLVSDASMVHDIEEAIPEVAAGVEELIDAIKMVAAEEAILLCYAS